MKKHNILLVVGLLLALFILSACGGSDGQVSSGDSGSPEPSSDNGADLNNKDQVQQAQAAGPQLVDDYTDALSIQGQLALGSLRLEDTEMAIDEESATELLPLWQALQSLMNSDTTAEIELEAVVNQIQDTMSAEQVAAIADMKLTQDTLTSMMENGELGFGRGAGRGDSGEGGFFGGLPEGFTPPEGDFVFVAPGGGPGGGGFGGGQGGGPGGFGGGPGGGFGNLDEDARATRIAEFASGDTGDFQETLLVGMVVRLLQQKSGQLPETFGRFDAIFDLIAEQTGLSREEIQAQAAEGTSLAEIVETNGGDLAAVRSALIDALSELPNASDLDLEQMADGWLGLSTD